jgi:peroxiredoxin
MAQLRQRKADLDALGASLYCVLPMDLHRAATFKKGSAGPYTTLSDAAGRTCAVYGVSKQLVVHNEWVNSPAVFVIDRKGVITYRYVGSSWDDRPTAETILEEARKASN